MAGRTRACALISLIGIGALCTAPAHAALGGKAADLMAEAVALGGGLRSQTRPQYDVDEIDTADGVTLREYFDRTGTVFAVSWSGPVPPDLRTILGVYFSDYTAGLSELAHPGLKRSLRLARSGLIVEAGGHLRAYSGRAYVPALLPAGVRAAEFR